MKRREFLKRGALMVVGAAVASTGATRAVAAPQWTAALKVIKPAEAEALLAMSRRIFPHSQLADSIYAKVVEKLDAEAASSADAAKQLRDGVATLDHAGDSKFIELSKVRQVAALEKIQGGEFFKRVHGVGLESIYSNPEVWQQFGYQGPSYEIGGYLRHGFNDLNWLAEPPAWASPKPA
ncbi:MAG: tat (twin-arginine translocation) pathway signal sequence [Candidatus Binataceae bacterium]